MPRIARPANATVSPREWALLAQLSPDGSEAVDAATLTAFQKQYGDASASAKGDTLTFEEFSALFARPKTAATVGEGNTLGYACHEAGGKLAPWRFNRRACGAKDIRIQITHASICHSDIHKVRNEWGGSQYPMVPGHEIVGIVTEVGVDVKKFKVGDKAGVGCMVNSCGSCESCSRSEEQYCSGAGSVATYDSKDRDGTRTYGGYSTNVVVVENFALHIPQSLALEGAAPLLCAGVTVWSPLRHFGLDKPGMHIGVVGLGGLGAHAVRFAKSFGCKVTVISTSPSKESEAKDVLGADAFVISKDAASLKAASQTLDGIINTVSAEHELAPLLDLIKSGGKMVCVGAPPKPPAMPTFSMLMRRLTVAGSLIGGIKETQEMLDYCGEKGIILPYETINVEDVNIAYNRVIKSDVRYRFVINIQGSLVQ